MVLYDPSSGNFYVRGNGGQTISVVNASTDTVLTSLTVGYGGSAYIPNVPTAALDLATGYLYETNPSLGTVGVIQTSTNVLTASIELGTSPGGIVFDPANGNLYTSNLITDNVSVISGTTNQVLTSIHVGGSRARFSTTRSTRKCSCRTSIPAMFRSSTRPARLWWRTPGRASSGASRSP